MIDHEYGPHSAGTGDNYVGDATGPLQINPLTTEPTPEQCSSNAKLAENVYACWYPQMGGYTSRCVISLHSNGCFDAYVWHDGEFPFGPDDNKGLATEVHHCDAKQFIDFGRLVQNLGRKP